MNQTDVSSSDRIIAGFHKIRETQQALSGKRPLSAVFLSVQKEQFCAAEPKSLSISDINFAILPDIAEVIPQQNHYDVCILACHHRSEEVLLFKMRNDNFAKLYFTWMWDNHHHHIYNMRTAILGDVVFPSHWHAHRYLNHPMMLCGPHIPLCSRQWSAHQIVRNYPNGLPVIRADGIFGGYGRYKWLRGRNEFIEQVMKECPNNALSLVDVDDYYQLPIAERLAAWINHKVHLVVPVARDLSARVFEALMTGQIPLVPDDIPDLDRVISPELQRSLPILRWKIGSVESVRAAWRDGIARFNSEGAIGVARRHAFARDHHSLTARLAAFATFVRKPRELGLHDDGLMMTWVESGSAT